MKRLLSIIVLCLSINAPIFGQNKTLYIVDSVPIIEANPWKNLKLNKDEIASISYVLEKEKMKSLGYNTIDSIGYIITKRYLQRPEALKRTPTTKLMTIINSVWFYNGKPYSGKYIDYYVNGIKEKEGEIRNGKFESTHTYYNHFGVLNKILSFKNSTLNGEQTSYYKNGSVLLKSYYLNNIKTGTWKLFHENSTLKKEYTYTNNKLSSEVIEYYSNGKFKQKYKQNEYYFDNPKSKDLRTCFHDLDYADGMLKESKKGINLKKLRKHLSVTNTLIDKTPIDDYFVYRGMIYGLMGENEASIVEFRKALELEPLNQYAKHVLVIALIKKNKTIDPSKISVSDRLEICNYIANEPHSEIHPLHHIIQQEASKYCID